ncbi:MAG: hypothetical protein H8E34_06215 [Bacteroidetes bacterium]|nr:hypothetical protein [Bacteroidota bacterium]
MFYQPLLLLRRILLFFVFFILISSQIFAQSYNKTSGFKSYWHIDANGGTSVFFGDIKQNQIIPVSTNENEWRFGGGVQLGRQISPVFGLRGQGIYGQLSGTRREWNRYFESNYFEFNLNTSVSIRNIITKYRAKQIWDVYAIIGIGITNYNTEVMDLTTKQVVQQVGYGSGKSFAGRTLQSILTGGGGINIRLADNWALNLETVNRVMNSDEMDGRISGKYYDAYNYTSLGISYKFGRSEKSKKSDDYSFFNPKETDKTVKHTDFDYNKDKPVEPPKFDVPVKESPPVEKETIKQEPIEIVVVEEQHEVIETIMPEFEYRVQIRAKYGNEISIQHLSNTYNIPAWEIKENTHNGFFIYTVGSFATYEQAREKRNQLRSYNGVSDAFVVAFSNGQRLNKLP